MNVSWFYLNFSIRKISILFLFILMSGYVVAQTADKPFIKLTDPLKEKTAVSSALQFIVGSSCKSCSVLINGDKVKVYPTGAFVYEAKLKEGDNSFTIVAISGEGKSISKNIHFIYSITKPAEPVGM